MAIYLIYILPLFIAYICFQIYSRLNTANKYHLTYLLFHFVSELFIAINLFLYHSFEVKIPIIVMSLIRIGSPMFLYLQILSIQNQNKVGLRMSEYIILSSLLIVNLLTIFGIKILPFYYANVHSGGYFELGVNYFKGKEEVFILITLAALYYIFSLIKTILKNTSYTSVNIKTAKLLRKWVSTYVVLYLVDGIFIICVLSLIFFDLYIDLFSIINKILALIKLFVLTSIAFLLKDLSSIKTDENTINEKYFKKIEKYFNTHNYFLDPTFSIVKISLDLGIRIDLISSSVKDQTQMTLPSYINSYRIKYACQLMQEGYLTHFSILSLAEKSGFGSQQSFNRSFKTIMKTTPSTYLNRLNIKT